MMAAGIGNLNEPHEHGVAGGMTQSKCFVCVQKKAAEQKAQAQDLVIRDKREFIWRQHNGLQKSEWKRLQNGLVPTLAELRSLSPQEFENEIARMYRRLGYTVTQTPLTNDKGRDAILQKGSAKYLLECKRYAEKSLSGRPDIQKFHSAIVTDKAEAGFFVSTAGFSREAIQYAKQVPVELIDGTQLVELMSRSRVITSQNDSYSTLCVECGASVLHHLRKPEAVLCDNKHLVPPSLSVTDVIGKQKYLPKCEKCGSTMRLVAGARGKFWGCSTYPKCRFTLKTET